MMRVSMGYPDAASEALMLRQRDTLNPLDDLRPVVGADRVRQLIAWARGVHVSPAVEEYAVGLARATRAHPEIRLGASPRATLQLVRAAKVWAALDCRDADRARVRASHDRGARVQRDAGTLRRGCRLDRAPVDRERGPRSAGDPLRRPAWIGGRSRSGAPVPPLSGCCASCWRTSSRSPSCST
jgi:hypothetical protein